MKKNILFMSVSVTLLILLCIGVSYSMWNMSSIQDTENVISTSDCFDISITSQENSISLKNAYPISNEKGKSLTPFSFTITNTCETAVKYSINLESLKGTTLSNGFLKIMVNNEEPKMLNKYDKVTTVNTGSIDSRILDTGTLFKNRTKKYSIRLWIDYDTTMEDLNNETKILKSKIIVTGTPSNEEEVLPSLLTERISYLKDNDALNFANDDPDSNIRYIGKDPSNYVYFNCSDYSNQTADTCEKWRIIGLFNNITKGDGTKENLIKIIRDDRLNDTVTMRWDYKQSGVGTSTTIYGSNDWTDSQLMMMLNPVTYLKSGYTNSDDIISYNDQQLYSKMGAYYNGTKGCLPASVESGANFACTEIDFSSTGLKNDLTRNAIEEVVWNLGGNGTSSLLASEFYSGERGTKTYWGRQATWTGKIGLMYPSDYGYATSGGSSASRTLCLENILHNWDSSTYNDCRNNNYLYKSSYYQWTLEHHSGSARYVFGITSKGNVYDVFAYGVDGVRPAIYLSQSISIKSGNGTSEEPFMFNIG